jgi:hypothetical protein
LNGMDAVKNHKEILMKLHSTNEKNEAVDRIEGDTIILHDFTPKEHRVFKTVKIITPEKECIRRIKKTQYGKYLMT